MEATEACTLTSRHVIVLLHYSLCCKYQYLFLILQIIPQENARLTLSLLQN